MPSICVKEITLYTVANTRTDDIRSSATVRSPIRVKHTYIYRNSNRPTELCLFIYFSRKPNRSRAFIKRMTSGGMGRLSLIGQEDKTYENKKTHRMHTQIGDGEFSIRQISKGTKKQNLFIHLSHKRTEVPLCSPITSMVFRNYCFNVKISLSENSRYKLLCVRF